ncbi:MAG: hypothetical protein HGB12_05520 [Bacteroidetes bacterium]|nr:hypothetical protein [Bacteroidota bacterium]
MPIEIQEYNLPDIEIFNNPRSDFDFIIWQPNKTYLVLGQSNKIEESLFSGNVEIACAPVLKRPSGGETVILTPNTLVISAVIIDKGIKKPHNYFVFFNNIIINGLLQAGIKNVVPKGISDLTIDNKKISGSSIYHKKDKIFFQSVLNVSESNENIVKYIKHPKREPDYRKGREHKEFITSLIQHHADFTIDNLIKCLSCEFIPCVK